MGTHWERWKHIENEGKMNLRVLIFIQLCHIFSFQCSPAAVSDQHGFANKVQLGLGTFRAFPL
jgi:hypothetical protein